MTSAGRLQADAGGVARRACRGPSDVGGGLTKGKHGGATL